MITNEDQARTFCAARCDTVAMQQLEKFTQLLAEENGRQNLVSRASLDHVWQRHIADSLQLLDHVPRETDDWLDLGSGAGLPGIPLAIAQPDLRFTLVESRRKRIEWLDRLKREFELENCTIAGSRLELLESRHVGVITARAFAPLGKLLNLSARFSTRSTLWLLPKGRSAAQELSGQPLKVQEMFHVEQSQTDPDAAILVGKGKPPI